MSDTIFTILALLPCVACFGIAGYMAINGIKGWGWFLIIGLFIVPTIKLRPGKQEKDQ